MRVHMMVPRMSMDEADILEYYLKDNDAVLEVKVNDRTADATIRYDADDPDAREAVKYALAHFSYDAGRALVPERTGRALDREFESRIAFRILRRGFNRLFVPVQIRNVLRLIRSAKYIKKGLQAVWQGRMDVAILDAVTIGVSLARGDYSTAGDIMFLLGLSDILEEYTHKKSVDDLARSMALNVDRAWVVTEYGHDELVPVSEIEPGSKVRLRTSNMIPLDGKVIEGSANVNQAALTGESMPVRKEKGSYVYAGTVLEEGDCVIEVKNASGSGRYDRIVRMIEESEKLKSDSENRAARLADRLVPWSFGGTALAYLLTRDVNRALAVLMVDFSCALKLTIPVAVLSAMREASSYGMSVKGGKFMETVAKADTIVFDKTGTLTYSTPKVADVIPFGDMNETECLRIAACLEEHFPHSIANAVVAEAELRGITHREMHSEVKYVVAHGIASHVGDAEALIGSRHFVFEDEACRIPQGTEEKFAALPDEYSHLFLAINGELSAVICIEDPIREEASYVISELHRLGIENVVMMTGDSERTARAVAAKVGVDEYHAEVLPEDKAAYVRSEKEKGRTVIMIGDGINDTPALSEADAAIAISNGAEIAREIADITIPENIGELLTLRMLGMSLTNRIEKNYRFILGFNSGLILLGVMGILPATTTAYLHNFSTMGLGIFSMTNLIRIE